MGAAGKPAAEGEDHAIPQEVLTEAATWLMEMHEGPLGPSQRVRLAQWRQRSPAHERAWEKAAILLDKFQTLPAPGAAALRSLSMPARRKAVKTLSAALVLGPAAWLAYRHAPWIDHPGRYITAVGERRDLILADGTAVSLNTDTELEVSFGTRERVLRLKRGEIMVSTAKDAAQPPRAFLVEVGAGRIRALGTRFNVRQLEHGSRVAVTEGAVELRPADRPAAALVLPAGMAASFSRNAVAPARPIDDSSLSWTSGMLMADRMPLAQWLAEIGRYRKGSLQADRSVAALPVSGVFPLADTDLSLALLAQTLPVRLQFFTRYWVRVIPR